MGKGEKVMFGLRQPGFWSRLRRTRLRDGFSGASGRQLLWVSDRVSECLAAWLPKRLLEAESQNPANSRYVLLATRPP